MTVRQLGLSGPRAAVAASRRRRAGRSPAASARKRVAVVNYPLEYFTRRIAGDRVEIVFPVPREEDPAFWKPRGRRHPAIPAGRPHFAQRRRI